MDGLALLLLLVGTFVVSSVLIGNPIGWATSRDVTRNLYNEAPWNWRVFLGPRAYRTWLERRNQ